jgi:hypothetical protein
VLFLDETGDPSMDYSRRGQPQMPEVFLLCGCLFDTQAYSQLEGAIRDLKLRHLGRTDLPLVSRQLRKHKGVFAFLDDDAKRQAFYNDIGALFRDAPFTVLAAAIDKYRYWQRYGDGSLPPYQLALAFLMERTIMCVSGRDVRVRVIAESRGRREDNELRFEFDRLLRQGTVFIPARRFRRCFLAPLEFRTKKQNVAGLQMADLAAYPLANRLCHPESRRIDFEIVYAKLHRMEERIWGIGLKVFPEAVSADYGL